jgi:rhodanese-related sulfurtransferase
MKKSIIIVGSAVFALALFTTGCEQAKKTTCFKPEQPHATGKELAKCVKGEIQKVDVAKVNLSDYDFVIDVRTYPEVEKGIIEGAKHIPSGKLPFKIAGTVKDKNANILLYCKKGGRSALATYTLNAIGYKNVTSMEGGYTGYMKQK